MNALVRLAGIAVLFGAAGSSWAQGLVDPTRPPPGFLPMDPKETAKEGEAKSDPGAVPVQVLLVGKTRRYALVKGELIGESTKGAKIVDVKRNDLIVQTDRGRETLNLFPDVTKTPPKKRAGMGEKDQ